MEDSKQLTKNISIEDLVGTVVKIPGVKVNRDKFLEEQFADANADMADIIHARTGASRHFPRGYC